MISPGKVTPKNDIPTKTEMFADPLIFKVFFNLIDNALRHGGRITTIQFSFETTNGNGIIVCEDDGEGGTIEEKEKIFNRGIGKNTWLGLTLAREILDITGITIKKTGEPGRDAVREGRTERSIPVCRSPVGIIDGSRVAFRISSIGDLATPSSLS
jgi:signal transduction histidine kinase